MRPATRSPGLQSSNTAPGHQDHHPPPPASRSPSPPPRLPKSAMRSDRPPPPRHQPLPSASPQLTDSTARPHHSPHHSPLPSRPSHQPHHPPPPGRPSHQPHHPPPPGRPSHLPPEPAFSHYPPYSMPPPLKRRRSGCSSCASCMLAFAFLLLLAIIAAVACFVLFRPQDPKIAVNSVRFPAFSVSNGTIDFTFFQYVAVRNPNRYSFSHYDSSLQLFYSGSQLGFMFIPAGQIAPGQTQYVSATFNVRSIPVTNQLSATSAVSAAGTTLSTGVGPTLEVETRMKMAGRVRVLKLLAHHVQSSARCRVTMEVSNGNVLGFHC